MIYKRRELWWALVSLNLVAATIYSRWPDWNIIRLVTAPLAAAISIYGGTGLHLKKFAGGNIHVEAIISAIIGGATAAIWWKLTESGAGAALP